MNIKQTNDLRVVRESYKKGGKTMAKAKGVVTLEEVDAANSWDDLKKLYTFEQVKSACRAKEVQRIAHSKYTYKNQLILEKAKADMKANPDKYADLQAELEAIK